MKTLAIKAKQNLEIIIISGLMVTFVITVIHHSIVYGTYSSPW